MIEVFHLFNFCNDDKWTKDIGATALQTACSVILHSEFFRELQLLEVVLLVEF